MDDMKVNNKKETVVFEDLKYGDAFSFYQFGDKTVYIKIRDSTDKMKNKAANIENGEIICLGGLEPVIKHYCEISVK